MPEIRPVMAWKPSENEQCRLSYPIIIGREREREIERAKVSICRSHGFSIIKAINDQKVANRHIPQNKKSPASLTVVTWSQCNLVVSLVYSALNAFLSSSSFPWSLSLCIIVCFKDSICFRTSRI